LPGSRCFSSSYRAVQRATEKPCLARVINKLQATREALRRELGVLCALCNMGHPNLCRAYEVCEDQRCFYFVTEVLAGGDLLSIAEGGRLLCEARVAQTMRQVLLGLQQLHLHSLCHGDLCPESVRFVSPVGSLESDEQLKLVGFGLSEKFVPGSASPCGTARLQCLPPERAAVFTMEGRRPPDPSGDLWAAGVLCFALLCGSWPLEAGDEQAFLGQLCAAQWAFEPKAVWAHIGGNAKDFVSLLLSSESGKRPGPGTMLQHPFIRSDGASKEMLRPIPQAAAALRRESAVRRLRSALVHSLSQCNPCRIDEARGFFEALDTRRNGRLPLRSLRRGLICAGVKLPGSVLESVEVLEELSAEGVEGEGGEDGGAGVAAEIAYSALAEVALSRRRHLEEDVTWAAWRTVVPGGNPVSVLGPEELARMPTRQMASVFSVSAADVIRGSKTNKVEGFEDFLTLMRKANEDVGIVCRCPEEAERARAALRELALPCESAW